MIDLEQRLTDAFHARADAVRPEELTRALPVARTRRRGPAVLGALAVAAAAVAVAVVGLGGGTDRATDPGPATPGIDRQGVGRAEQVELVPLAAGATASYGSGATGTLTDGRFEVTAGGASWSVDVAGGDHPALTSTTVDLGGTTGYVVREGSDADPSFSVFVIGPDGRLVRAGWEMPVTRIELPPAEHAPGYVGWLTWVGTDGRLYDTAYRGKRVPEETYRWILSGGTAGIPAGQDEVELTPRHLPTDDASD